MQGSGSPAATRPPWAFTRAGAPAIQRGAPVVVSVQGGHSSRRTPADERAMSHQWTYLIRPERVERLQSVGRALGDLLGGYVSRAGRSIARPLAEGCPRIAGRSLCEASARHAKQDSRQ